MTKLKLFRNILLWCLLLLAPFYFILATNQGLQVVYQCVAGLLPGKLTIHKIEGNILSGIDIDDLHYVFSTEEVLLPHLSSAWSASDLFMSKLWIKKFDIRNLIVKIKNTNTGNANTNSKSGWSEPFSFSFLQHVKIHEANVDNVLVEWDKRQFTLSHLQVHTQNNQIIFSSQAHFVDAFAKLNGQIGDKWQLNWEVAIPALEHLYPEMQGKITGNGSLDSQHDLLSSMQIHAEQLTIMKNDYVIPELNLTLNTKNTNNKLVTRVVLTADPEDHAQGEITLTPASDLFSLNQEIKGKLAVEFNRFAKVLTIPQVKNIQGKLNGEVLISGKLASPVLSAEANLQQGELLVPKVNAHFQQVQLHAQYHTANPIEFDGVFSAGGGNGKLTGKLDLEKPGKSVDLQVTGENLFLVNLPEYQLHLSPKINLQYANNAIEITGNILLDSARINPTDFSSITTLPQETVIVGKQTPEETMPANFSLNIALDLGQHTSLSWANLDTGLTGQLEISKQGSTPVIASGQIHTIKGKYHAYGQNLKITRGNLIYAGNLVTDPGLDIETSKEFTAPAFASDNRQMTDNQHSAVYQGKQTITAGIMIKGTAKKPRLEFFSKPMQLKQNDIISYLLFGAPQSGIKDKGSLAILNQIVLSSQAGNMSGGATLSSMTGKLKNLLGLSDISLSSIETYDATTNSYDSSTAVSIKKNIGKKISVQYRVGIFNPLSVLNLKYKISKRWALQTETSSQENGADLLFEYEHD